MSVLLIMDIDITDEPTYAEYRKLVPPIIEQYGGQYRARGGWARNIEGDWEPERIVIVEFASEDQARAFIESEEYAPVKAIRHAASISKGILVESFTG